MIQEYDITLTWRAFPLHPEVPSEGILFHDLFADYPMDIENIADRMQKTAAELGLPMARQDRIYNTRLAQELGVWAQGLGRGSYFHQAAFRAYFSEGKNLARLDVLTDLAHTAGLPGDQAQTVLRERKFEPAVDADWDLARSEGITAVPTLLINSQKLVGAQPYATMAKFVQFHGAQKRL